MHCLVEKPSNNLALVQEVVKCVSGSPVAAFPYQAYKILTFLIENFILRLFSFHNYCARIRRNYREGL